VLGLLIGSDEGLFELIPGETPAQTIEGSAITTIDYRDGLGVAAGPDGAWAHDGQSWERVWTAEAGTRGRAVRVDPAGLIYLGVEPAALLVSTDRGAQWEAIEGVRTLLRHERQIQTPSDAEAPYASGLAFPSDGFVLGIAGGGAWSSRDGGGTWLRRSEGLDPMVRRLWEHPERGDRLYASTDSGLYRTDDGGFTWVQSLRGLDRSFAGDVVVVPGTPDRLLLALARQRDGASGALYISTNGGVTWQIETLGDRSEFAHVPLLTRVWDSEDTLFALADGVAWGSHDGGRNWVALAEGLPERDHALVAAL
jgi:photosystem II stability/assembly factor-like uncharacterized protein